MLNKRQLACQRLREVEARTDAALGIKLTRHRVVVAGSRAASSTCPPEMALKRSPGAIEFTFRVEMEHYSCDVTPVGVRVEQPEIRDEVFLVIGDQCDTGGRGIGDVW